MVKRTCLFFVILSCFAGSAFGQDIEGDWEGYFIDKRDTFPIALRLEKSNDSLLSGKCYTFWLRKKDTIKCICKVEGIYIKRDSTYWVLERQVLNGSHRRCTDWSAEKQYFKLHFINPANDDVLTGAWGFVSQYFNRQRSKKYDYPVYLKHTRRNKRQIE